MTEIQITPYEKVLYELTLLCGEFKPYNPNSNYKIGVHLVFNYTSNSYIIMHCFGFKEYDYAFVHWINTEDELNRFTENDYEQICEELRFKFKKHETETRLNKLTGDF